MDRKIAKNENIKNLSHGSLNTIGESMYTNFQVNQTILEGVVSCFVKKKNLRKSPLKSKSVKIGQNLPKNGRKTVKNIFLSEFFFKSINTIRIHVCVKFHAYWCIFGLKMGIFRYFLVHFGLIIIQGISRKCSPDSIPRLTVSALTFDSGILVTTVKARWKGN